MSFDINSNLNKLSLNKSNIKQLNRVPVFQEECNEKNEEERMIRVDGSFYIFSVKIQQLLNSMECIRKNHRNLIIEFYKREEKFKRKLDNLEYKLLQSDEKVCKTIEKLSILVKKELSNFYGNCNSVSKNKIESEMLKNTDSYGRVESFDKKNDKDSNNVVPSNSSSRTTIFKKSSFVWSNDIIDDEYYSENSILNCEYCTISDHNSIISSVDMKNNSNPNTGKYTSISYTPCMDSKNNVEMVSEDNFKLFKNNNEEDDLKSECFAIKDLIACKTEFENSYRLSNKLQSYSNLNASKKQSQFDNLNKFLNSYLNLIYNNDEALFYQYKSNFLLKYLNKQGSTCGMNDVTYRILFDSKEREFFLVIEKSTMNNSKLIAKINKSIKFFLVDDHEAYCECTDEDSNFKEKKTWMMSFDNKNDSKKLYDIANNIQDKQ
uniref:PH domain-containing protein n=1 Tax=Strongyloides venezuelensis TaxID=75913 RepID=A0A0K0F5B6_STRVS